MLHKYLRPRFARGARGASRGEGEQSSGDGRSWGSSPISILGDPREDPQMDRVHRWVPGPGNDPWLLSRRIQASERLGFAPIPSSVTAAAGGSASPPSQPAQTRPAPGAAADLPRI